MKNLLAIPNDPLEAYFRSSKEDFLGEFNPLFKGERFFDEIRFLNWRDLKDGEYFEIKSKAILTDKRKAEELYFNLMHSKVLFDSSNASFIDIFSENVDKIKKEVETFKPNLIRAFNTHFALDIGKLARQFSSAPLMVSAHDPTRLTHSIKDVDVLVCESYELQELAKEKFGVDPRKISVIHNGIDRDFFKPQAEKDVAKYVPKEFLDAPYKLFSSSRLVRGKNIEGLLKAISLVREDLPGLIHLHVGDEGSQPNKAQEIKNIKNELELTKISYFLGSKKKSELPAYYSWADVFVLPTLWEGLSRVMRESLACGTPVIATNYGSSTEIVQDEFNGLSIDPTNSNEIASTILRFFKENGLKDELEHNARSSSEKYSLTRSMRMYSNLYRKLMN